MVEDFNSSQPIYYQILQRICRQIVRGEVQAGDKLPSVRELAVQSGVNPNTAQRVYTELERLHITETRRGQGTFVTEDQSQLQSLRDTLKSERIQAFLQDMREMGYTDAEIVAGIQHHQQSEEGSS
ncbi:GntR family transcriptional regulator [Tumebacillus permanentifrigoris]|uniref:DNA-binding transcriptional regulator YhcF (GntR family) n=1 Tax=Tumebacillus permanentifrigoris TaxID=378543 RepID=A0A316D820_9BACL|nr:GntR family transcriptional regulator [Tumebacillus permanentifrigoris]PWK09578.1 DNA-binding transcriptional regulator YhcF (GntR family) [Tumebacillus permanentifrigoris]